MTAVQRLGGLPDHSGTIPDSPSPLAQAVLPYFPALILRLALIVAAYAVVHNGGADANRSLVDTLNLIGPLATIAVLGATAFSMLKAVPISVWTPAVLFLGSSALFFGVGPLVHVLGSEATLAYLASSRLALSAQELLRTNLLSSLGILATVVGIYLGSWFLAQSPLANGKRGAAGMSRRSDNSVATLALIFLVAGGFLRFFVILPYNFGMIDITIPGVLTNLGKLLDLGLAIVAYLAARGRKEFLLLLWIVLPIHFLSTVLEFSKSSAVIAILMPALGKFIADRKMRSLMSWILVSCFVFYLLQPLVNFGRLSIALDTGTIHRAPLSVRWKLMHGYYRGEYDTLRGLISAHQPEQMAWLRLSYAGPQIFAMREYDRGRPGDTFGAAWTVFVPRLLWNEKPVGIGPGREFYERVTGRESDSYLALSVYGDAYWTGGWLAVISMCLAMGFLFALLSLHSLTWIARLDLIYLPVIFLSFSMALMGPTKFFINGIIAPLPVYIAYLLAVNVVTYLLQRLSRSR